MELLDSLALGFSVAFSLKSLGYAFLGCLLGTMVGILPGLGPLATIAMLLPFTYGLEPLTALIMLAGIYYGSQYGGSTTAILINLPGEVSSVVTMLDGHKLAQQGRAGVALATAAIASFVAGTLGTLVLAGFAHPLTRLVLNFGAPEYFSLMLVGLIGAVIIASGSVIKAIGMILIGLLIGLSGTDVNTGTLRFTFGLAELWDGVEIIVVAVGLFTISEIIVTLENRERRDAVIGTINTLWPSWPDIRRMIPAILRGSTIGSIVGVMPGAGLSVASFLSYTMEKRVSRTPERFGTGAIEGVAAPEAANNAAAQTAFIPTLMLGIPGSATMALMLGAMMIHNIQPGPQVMTRHPELFWGLIASMWLGNVMLLVLNLPLVQVWVKVLKIPYRLLYPAILVFCCVGVYSYRYLAFDVLLAMAFGLLGYVFSKLKCEPAPLVLGMVLGPMMEEHFRRALLISRGDFTVFLTRPISAALLGVAAVLVVLIVFPAIRRTRKRVIAEDA
ncbi:MAG: tripartite tricarboxylate transporter permease [Rhodobacteraceae bacterium]|nr:tripartite tricarboxylate transporter permease [Paracoccaceae bacterium]